MTVSSETLHSISTPDRLETRLGMLEFVDGVPTRETAETVYDHLDFAHALNVFLNGFPGASTQALRKGLHDAGVEDNAILIFSELMDSNSLFLTANADTVYFVGIVDLSSGPMVVETPPQALALFDDMWFQWIVDFGLPGPDRGEGGRFLLLPPGYDGSLPDSGYHVRHSRTMRAFAAWPLVHDENPTIPLRPSRRSRARSSSTPMPRAASGRASRRCSRATCTPIRRWTFLRRSSWRAAGTRSTRSHRATSASSSC